MGLFSKEKKIKADFKFNLGDEVTDNITGFTGIVICRTQWLNSCNVYGVKSRVLKDGLVADTQYFDQPQLVVFKKKVIKPYQNTGGPAQAVPQANRS